MSKSETGINGASRDFLSLAMTSVHGSAYVVDTILSKVPAKSI